MLVPLPIDPLVPRIVESLRRVPNAVVVAPPGAGKTTRLPPALAAEFSGAHRMVAVLQPRRAAARAAAARIAQEQGWRMGEEVGYQIRYENRTSPRTRVAILTEGILTRRIQSDPFLEGIGCVVLDEFHERSLHADLALAFLREIQSTVREDLRIVVMSATLNPGPVAEFLGNAPVFASEGRLHPIQIEYLDRSGTEPVWEKAAAATRRAFGAGDDRAESGHLLVFLPGIGEIRRAANLLGDVNAELHILHSSVSDEDQDRALRPGARRKLILATNIAETSLTIDGVRTVIDSGLARIAMSDARLGIDRLELRRISRASADQRAGRAGRTAPGHCHRLWTRAEDAALEERETPEIRRVDLAGAALAVRAYGARDLPRFNWFEPPLPESLERAEGLLRMLGAVDPKGGLTALGKRLAALPAHPRLGALLLAGAESGLLREAATLAALLSEKDILAESGRSRKRQAQWEGTSDLLARLELLESNPQAPELDPQAVRAVLRARDEFMEAASGKSKQRSPKAG